MGAKGGVPDLCLPIPRGGKNGLYIELKRPEGIDNEAGSLQEKQSEWLERLNEQGYFAIKCEGAEEAVETIKSYLEA